MNLSKMISDLYDLLPKKNNRGLCAVRYCSRTKLSSRSICSRCQRHRRRQNDPIGYTYDLLKQNAKRRGKVFTISKDYFRAFCLSTGYMDGKGKKAESMSIDRIDPSRGYEPGNIQVLSLSANSTKRHEDCPF